MKKIMLFLALIGCVIAIEIHLINVSDKETMDQFEQINNPQLIALDSIAENYISEGWTCDAAYLIAAFEVDLYDESDTAEYALYRAYMED